MRGQDRHAKTRVERLQKSVEVLNAVMSTPDKKAYRKKY